MNRSQMLFILLLCNISNIVGMFHRALFLKVKKRITVNRTLINDFGLPIFKSKFNCNYYDALIENKNIALLRIEQGRDGKDDLSKSLCELDPNLKSFNDIMTSIRMRVNGIDQLNDAYCKYALLCLNRKN